MLLGVDDGEFVSMLDPDEGAEVAVAGCAGDGTWPVLIGDDARVMLAAPIILYDRPEIAPESDGDLCDATEIDEILALRILTLTDDEKAEARATDRRAAAIVDRIDDMTPDALARLHGTMRELRPVRDVDADDVVAVPWWEPAVDAAVDPWTDTVQVGGVEVATGTRCGSGRRAAPTRTTCSFATWSRPSPACSTTSTTGSTSRSRSTTTRRRRRCSPMAGISTSTPTRSSPSDERTACSWPGSATSSWVTTASASRSPNGCGSAPRS